MDKKSINENKEWIKNNFKNDYIYQKENSDIILVIFSGLQDGLNMPVFEFKKIIDSIKWSKLFFKDTDHLWYLKSDKHIINIIENIIKKYKKIIFIGASAGGFAAIKYGSIFKCDKIISLGPQTTLNKKWFEENNDKRWKKKINYISKNYNNFEIDLLNYINETPIEIHYCKNNINDKLHAKRLNKNCFEYNCNTHAIGKYLKNENLLLNIIKKEL